MPNYTTIAKPGLPNFSSVISANESRLMINDSDFLLINEADFLGIYNADALYTSINKPI